MQDGTARAARARRMAFCRAPLCIATLLAGAATLAGDAAQAGARAAAAPAPGAPLTADQFAAYAEGRTLIYRDAEGMPWGAEQHLPGNRVVWSGIDGDCERGQWFVSGGRMCFIYQDDPQSGQCWTMQRAAAGGLTAIHRAGDAELRLTVEAAERPLTCGAPGA